MFTANTERRRFFRIDDTLCISYRLIDPETASAGLKAMEPLSRQFSVAATLDVLSQEAQRIMLRIEKQNPEWLELYQVLDAKINTLAQAMMFACSDVDAQNCRDVNLSASGVAFAQSSLLDIGQNLAIEMYLPSTLALILVYGKVVNCQELAEGQYSISVDYTHIRAEDQELLIKHVVRRQWQQLQQNKMRAESLS
jgi:PilZ domain.